MNFIRISSRLISLEVSKIFTKVTGCDWSLDSESLKLRGRRPLTGVMVGDQRRLRNRAALRTRFI